jgi:hypothetical protein
MRRVRGERMEDGILMNVDPKSYNEVEEVG